MHSKVTTSKKERFLVLDSLRGLASIFVVLYHYTTRYQELYCKECEPLMEISYGGYGVELFFILSGFVIFYSAQKNGSLLSFLYSRFFRLYPVYWLAILITTLFIIMFGLEERDVFFLQFLVNLTMLQEYLRFENIDGVYWSLAIELAFYIVIGLLLHLKLISKIVLFINTWVIFYTIMRIYFLYKSIDLLPSYVLTLFDYSLLFCIGILFNKYYYDRTTTCFFNIITITLIYLLLSPTSNILVSFSIIFIFYLFVKNKLEFLVTKPLLFLGTISYPLYLIHQNIGYILMNELPTIDINIRIILSTLVVISLSYICHLFVEKPSMRVSSALRKRFVSND